MSKVTKEIDPITGLPVTDITDPITGLPYQSQESLNSFRRSVMNSPKQLSPSAGFAASTGDFSAYSNYGVQITPNPKDFAEVRAQLQPMGEKYRRGLKKLGVTAGSSFINTFTGMAGVADWAGDLITDYDNASLERTQAKWARAIDTEEWREQSRKDNPHYYTQEELQNVGTLDGMFTANFVSDKLFDGAGFFLGTAASLYTTGGVSLLGAAGRAANVSKALAAYRVGKTLRSGASVSQALKQGVRVKTGLNKAGKWAAHLEASAYSAMGESALEAREAGKRTYDALYKQAISRKMLAGEPSELSPQELQQIKLQAMESEGAAFYSNLAVLTASNSITFKGLLRPFAKGRVGSKFFRPTTAAEKAAGKGAVVDRLAGLPGYGIRQTAQAARYAAPLGKVMLTEGTEEAAQYAITEGLTDFQLARAKDAGLGDMVESLIGANSLLTAIDASPDVVKRLSKTFVDPEAREQFIIGSLIGILGGGISGNSIKEMKQKDEMRKKQLELFNNPEFYKIAGRTKTVSEQSTYLEEMERAQKEGDQEVYEYFQRKLQAAQVLQHKAAGSLDMYIEMLQDTKELTDKEFKELFGYDESQKIDKNEVIDNLIKDVKEIEKSAEYVDTMFSTENNRSKLSRLFMSEEAKQLEEEEQKDEEVYKDFLKHEMATANMIGGAIRNKLDKIEKMFPGVNMTIETAQEDGRVRVVDMKQRLRNYARNRFGEVVEGEDGALEPQAIQGPKLRDSLNLLALEAQNRFGNDVEYTLFVKELVELRDLIVSKDNGATALRNLMRSPETRDLAISRAKLAETIARREKIDKAADEAISDTITPEELVAKKEGLQVAGVSEKGLARVEEEIVRRKAERSEAKRTWDTMTKTAVKDLTELSPLQQKYRDEYLAERQQEAPRTSSVEEARRREAQRQARTTTTKTKLAAEETPQGSQTTTSADSNQATSNSPDALFTSYKGQREIAITPDGKVVVTTDGKPLDNEFHKERTVNGKPVIDRPDLLDTEEVKAGTEVELVVIEDAWWLSNQDKFTNKAEHIPIYVRVPGKGVVGILTSNNSALRRAVYENWKEGNQDQRFFSNIALKDPSIKVEDGYGEDGFHGGFGVYIIDGKIVKAVKNVEFDPRGPELVNDKVLAALQKQFESEEGLTTEDPNSPLRAQDEVPVAEDLSVVTGEEVYKAETQQRKKGPVDVEYTRKQSYKDGVRTTKFGIRKKGSDSTSSNAAPVETALGNQFEVDPEYIEDGVIVTGVYEIKEGESGVSAKIQVQVVGKEDREVRLIRKSKPSGGQAVTIKIDQKLLNNRNNARVELADGTAVPYLSNVFEIYGNIPLGVVKFSREGNLEQKTIVLGNTQNLSPVDLANLKQTVDNARFQTGEREVKYGQVVGFFKDSNGKWRYNILQTARLNEAEQTKAMELLGELSSDGAYQELIDLVGLNKLDPAVFNVNRDTYLHVEKEFLPGGENKRMIRLGIPIPTSDSVSNKSFLVAAIDSVTLGKLMRGEITAEQIKADKKVFGNLIQEITPDTERGEDRAKISGVGYNVLKGEVADQFINSIVQETANLLTRKSRQVNADRLSAPNGADYVNSIVNEQHQRPATDRSLGYSGVLSTDVIRHNGSLFHGIGLSFDVSSAKVGGKKITTQSAPIVAPVTTTNSAQALFDQAAEQRQAAEPENVASQEPDPDMPADIAAQIAEMERTGQKSSADSSLDKSGIDPDLLLRIIEEQENKPNQSTEHPDQKDLDDALDNEEDPFGPTRLVDTGVEYEKMSKAQAEAWLSARGIPVEFYDIAKRVGNRVAHGYMRNATVYLYNNAEVGTEYHEAYHYVFRTLLDEKQREALYREARTRFADSLREKGIDPSKATNLQLEEEMAEGLRDYIFTAQGTEKTLPQKILQFFKDILNFIRSVFGNPASIEQIYDMIERNKLGKVDPELFERNKEQFQNQDAYRLVSSFADNFELQTQVRSSITTVFIDQLQQIQKENVFGFADRVLVQELLGQNEENRGEIAEFFLRHSVKMKDGEYISEEAFDALRKAKTPAERGKVVADYNIVQGFPTVGSLKSGAFKREYFMARDEKGNPVYDENGKARFVSDKALMSRAKVFFNVWNNWFNVEDELGNVDKFGWREAAIMDLKKYGYNIKSRVKLRGPELEDEGLPQKEETNYDKIYAISHFETDPLSTVAAEVRAVFSKIRETSPNVLGFNTYVNVQDAIRAAVAVSADSSSYPEIIGRIQESEVADLAPIVTFINSGQMTAKDAAALTRFLTKTYSEQRIIMEEIIDDETVVKAVRSDRKSRTLSWSDTWSREGKSTDVVPRVGAVLIETEDGNLKFHNNVIDGKSRLQHIKAAVNAYYTETDVDGKAEAVGNLMYYMSLSIGKNRAQSNTRVRAYLSNNPQDLNTMFTSLINIANRSKLFDITVTSNVVRKISLNEGNSLDMFTKEGTSIKALAEVAAQFELPKALAFVNGKGKTIYPYNLPTPFSETIADLEKGAESKLYKLMMQDESLAMDFDGNDRARALMLYLIENENFDISTFALDSVVNEILDDGPIDYSKMSERDSLILRLNLFLNNGGDKALIPIPTQESRQRLDVMTMPRFGDPTAASIDAAGIPRTGSNLSAKQLFTRIMLRDLVRLANKPQLATDRNNGGFHLTGLLDAEVDGVRLSKQVKNAIKYEGSPDYKNFYENIGEQIDNYINTVYVQHKKDFIEELAKFNIVNIADGKYTFPEGSRLDGSRSRYASPEALIDAYMISDLVSRVEMAQMFRGGLAQFRDTTDFYKRMGLINTPGDKLMLKGEFEGDPDYGMAPIVKEATISKMNVQEEYHDKIAEKILQRNIKHFQDLGQDEVTATVNAGKIGNPFKRDNEEADHTDAQAFISPRMFKYIEQGLGRWTKEDDIWFDEFMNEGGLWKARYTPAYKFFADEGLIDEFGTMMRDLQKNSYVVLTPALVAGNDLLTGMYNRMMKKEDPIDIINTISAKKSYKGNVFNVDQSLGLAAFNGLQSRPMDASTLYMPQVINDKEDTTTKMNRKIFKVIPTMGNTAEDAKYTLSDGSTVSGQETLRRYLELKSEIVEEQGKKLAKEIGFDKLAKDPNNNELRLEFLQRIRDMIYDNAMQNDSVDSNLDQQLRIVVDPVTGRPDFNIPLSFPTYQRKYSNLISSLFKTNVHTVKMPGKELVQVAGPGKWRIGDEVRELRHLDIDEKTGRTIHSEILVSEDILEKLGLEVGATGILYRIPNQDYSSNVPSKIVGVLPKGYTKTVIVPGNITIQTGSDFDIDKLFALFRKANAKSKLDKMKNELLDLAEAVLLDEATQPYLFKPLTQETLDALAEDELYKREGARAFDHPLVEVKMESNYKSAQTLVGGYANGMAGWNISAVASQFADPDSDYVGSGIIINPSKHFILNEKTLNQITPLSPFTGARTLDGIVERLSAALDVGKKLIHTTLNDNEHTLNATTFLKSIGFEDADVVAMMTMPLVRQFVEQRRTTSKSVKNVFKDLGIPAPTYTKIVNNDQSLKPSVVDTAVLRKITADNDTTSKEAKDAFMAFAKAYVAGNSLSDYYKVIASDNLDGMGDFAEKEEYLDVLDNYRRAQETNIVDLIEVEKILVDDAYLPSKTHFEQIQKEVEMSTQLFITGTVGVRAFKSHFKDVTGKTKLTQQEHRFMDRAMFYHMLTKEGSPIAPLLNKAVVKDMLLDGTNNLYTQVQQLKEDIPTLQDHAFLAKVVESPGYSDPMNRVWGIGIENTEKMTPKKRQEVIKAFHQLLYSPEIYTKGMENSEELNKRIRNLGQRLALNAIVTTGLAPSYGTYYNSIPVDFFLGIKNEETGETLLDFYRKQEAEVRLNPQYFGDFMFDFVQNFGTATVGGRRLIPKMPPGFLQGSEGLQYVARQGMDLKDLPLYTTVNNFKKGVDKVSVYQLQDGVYYKIQSLGINGKLLELNLRDAAEDIVRTSVWNGELGERKVRIKTSKGKPKTVNLDSRKGDTKARVLPVMKPVNVTLPSESSAYDKLCNS